MLTALLVLKRKLKSELFASTVLTPLKTVQRHHRRVLGDLLLSIHRVVVAAAAAAVVVVVVVVVTVSRLAQILYCLPTTWKKLNFKR